MLFFFPSDEAYLRRQHRGRTARLGLPTELLDAAEMRAPLPDDRFHRHRVPGCSSRGFGALMARRAVQTLVAEFVAPAATIGRRWSLPPAQADALQSVATRRAAELDADASSSPAAPGCRSLSPTCSASRIFPTRQEVFFFAPPAGDRRFLPGAMPGWADFNGGDIYYGFPDLEGRGFKIAHDAHGPPVDPDTQSRDPTRAALADVRAFRDRRFPLLAGAPLTEARGLPI